MADDYTVSGDLYDPEVWASLVQAEFTGKAIVATSGAVLTDDTLVGQPGSTVTFPKWMLMGDVAELAETDVMEVDSLTQSSSKATIKEVGKAFGIHDKASLVGLGNPQDEAIRQLGILVARKIDADLIDASAATVVGGIEYADGTVSTDSACLTFATAEDAPASWDVFAEAVEEFGDDFEPSDFAGLYIRSEQRTQVWKDEHFIRASELSAGGQGSMVSRGYIGDIAGIGVFVTNRLPVGKARLLKRNSLGLMYKRRPIVERDRDILARQTVTATNVHYAVKRLNDSGVLDITFTNAV